MMCCVQKLIQNQVEFHAEIISLGWKKLKELYPMLSEFKLICHRRILIDSWRGISESRALKT